MIKTDVIKRPDDKWQVVLIVHDSLWNVELPYDNTVEDYNAAIDLANELESALLEMRQ